MESIPVSKKLTLNENTVNSLEIVRKWALFFSVLGFIWIAFMVLMFLGLGFVPFGFHGSGLFGHRGLTMLPVCVMLLSMSVLYFFPVYYLYKFSVFSKIAIKNLDTECADRAFGYLKKHYRFIGVLTIIILAIYLLTGFLGMLSFLAFKF